MSYIKLHEDIAQALVDIANAVEGMDTRWVDPTLEDIEPVTAKALYRLRDAIIQHGQIEIEGIEDAN